MSNNEVVNNKVNLTVSVEVLEGLKRKIKVEFPKSIYDTEYGKIVDYVARTTSIPGFRKGKVPNSVIKNKYANYINDQVESDLKTKTLEDAIKQESLAVAAITDLDNLKITDKTVSFTAVVELHPELNVTGYKGLKFNLVDAETVEPELTEWINNYTKEKATYEDVKSDASPKRGEWVKLDVLNYQIEGVTEKPNDQKNINFYIPKTGENYYSDPTVNDKFVDLLLKMKPNEQQSFSVTYPNDYKEEFFKGKTVKGDIKYLNLLKKVEPKLTDEMVKNDKTIYANDIEGLKKYFEENIKSIRSRQQEEELVSQIQKSLLDSNKFDIPEYQIDGEVENLRQHWGRLNDNELKEKAIENIKFRYLVSEIISKENLNAKPEELAAKMPKDTSSMKQEDLDKMRAQIENTLLWTNFISFIKDNATIKYYNPSDKKKTNAQAQATA